MNNISQEKVTEIRNSVDIVDVISRYLNVVRKGKNYFALCPFHNDNNPSLSISKDKQIYKCFVCNEGGNVITFIQKYKNISFFEALKELAEIGGVDFDYQEKDKKSTISPKKQIQYDLLKDCTKFYQNGLSSSQVAQDYIQTRNFDKETIYEFKIGYSLDFEKLIRYLQSKKYTNEDILKSGIAVENDGKLMDRFAHRLIFPITDLQGNITAFSGRIIEKNDMAKYVNSPETEIFIKGDTFYHYFDALPSIRKNKKVYICEGFMDVIALFKAGIPNAIALMGTAFTKQHLKVLKFLGVDVVLTLDGDAPGNMAAFKLANELDALQIRVEIISNYREAKDVDEFYNRYGKEQLLEHLNSPLSFFDFYLDIAKKEVRFNNFEEKKKFAQKVAKYLAKKDELEIENYLKKLEALDLPRHTMLNLIKKNKEVIQNPQVATKVENKPINWQLKVQLLFMINLLNSTEAIEYFLQNFVYLPEDKYRKLADFIAEYYTKHHKITIADLYSDDEKLNTTLTEILNAETEMPDYNQASFQSLVYNINECIPLATKINALKEELNYILDNKTRAKVSQEIIELRAQLKRKQSTGGKYEEKSNR